MQGLQRIDMVKGVEYVDAGATATDTDNGNLTNLITVSNSVNSNIPGEYRIDYEVSDASGNTATLTRVVRVWDYPRYDLTEDTWRSNQKDYIMDSANHVMALTILVTSPFMGEVVYVGDGTEPAGTTWTENAVDYPKDGTLDLSNTDGKGSKEIRTYLIEKDGFWERTVIYKIGEEMLSVQHTQKAGNVCDLLIQSSANPAVTRTDFPYTPTGQMWVIGKTPPPYIMAIISDTAPVILLNGTQEVLTTVGAVYVDAGATANDLESGDLTSSITTTNSVDTATAGTYAVHYNVSDAQGNQAVTKGRTVRVLENVLAFQNVFANNTVTFANNETHIVADTSNTYTYMRVSNAGENGSLTRDFQIGDKVLITMKARASDSSSYLFAPLGLGLTFDAIAFDADNVWKDFIVEAEVMSGYTNLAFIGFKLNNVADTIDVKEIGVYTESLTAQSTALTKSQLVQRIADWAIDPTVENASLIENANTGSITNMNRLLAMYTDTYAQYNFTPEQIYTFRTFNIDITGWDTNSVVDMDFMLYGLIGLENQDLSAWDVSNVTTHANFNTDVGANVTLPNFTN